MQNLEDPMNGFRKISRNGPKTAKQDFSGKIRKCHFPRIRKPQLCAKNQEIPMNGF